MPSLRDLDAWFIQYETRIEPHEHLVGDPETWQERGRPTETVTGPREYMTRVETLAEAQGVMLRCPCGTGHYIQVTFANRGVRPEQGCHGVKGEPTRWDVVSGSSLDDLTTRPSILIGGPCQWHGFITNGVAT